MKLKALTLAAAIVGSAVFAHASCAPPPPWRQVTARGHPDAEISACLKNKAYDARDVEVPMQSKVAGVIAQCEVDVDRYEGAPFGGANSWNEQWVSQQAEAAIVAYRSCEGR